MAGPEGERPRVERTSQPNKPTEQHKPQLEGGNGAPGIAPTLHERAKPPPPESQERQPLPSVCNYLERFTRLHAPDVADRPRWGTQVYKPALLRCCCIDFAIPEYFSSRDM